MSYITVARILSEPPRWLWFVWFYKEEATQIHLPLYHLNATSPANEANMTEPKPGDTFRLPSNSIVKVERKHQNESFACSYIDALGNLLSGRALSPGVTLTNEFLMLRCARRY